MGSINATNSGTLRELIPAGNYIARAYQMLHIGTIPDTYMGQEKIINKVRIGWELPNELKIFKPENGEQPLVISKEFTLSMNEKANLRKMLASWRGLDFTEEEAKSFDITKLLGKACMLNIIHRTSKEGKVYEDIASISPMPKGVPCPAQINKTILLTYDEWSEPVFESLPDFIKNKIKTSQEYQEMRKPEETHINGNGHEKSLVEDLDSDLPF